MGVRAAAKAITKNPSANLGSDEAAVADSLTPGGLSTPGGTALAIGDTPLSREEPDDLAGQGLPGINEARGDIDLDSIIHVPHLSKDTFNRVLLETNVPPPAIKVSEDIDAERAHIWAKILESQAAGDSILTKHLMSSWTSLDEPKTKPQMARAVSATPVLLTVESRMVSKSVKAEKEHGLVYAVGAVSSHQDVGFTPYFEENIKALKTPIPLTIFNNEWKKRAIRAHIVLRQARPGDNEKAYKVPTHPNGLRLIQNGPKITEIFI